MRTYWPYCYDTDHWHLGILTIGIWCSPNTAGKTWYWRKCYMLLTLYSVKLVGWCSKLAVTYWRPAIILIIYCHLLMVHNWLCEKWTFLWSLVLFIILGVLYIYVTSFIFNSLQNTYLFNKEIIKKQYMNIPHARNFMLVSFTPWKSCQEKKTCRKNAK